MSDNNYKRLIVKIGRRHSDMLYDIAQRLNCSNLRALQVCLASEYRLESKTGKYWRAKKVKARTLFLAMSLSETQKKDLLVKDMQMTFTSLCMSAIAACHRKLFTRNQEVVSQQRLVKYLPNFNHADLPMGLSAQVTGAST